MTEFAKFMKDNRLSGTELATYLGVPDSFISRIKKGDKKLPPEQRAKLLSNPYGWDTSMLEDHEKITYTAHSEGGDAFFGSKVVKGSDVAVKLQIKALIDQIDILKEQLRTQEQQYEKRLAEERARTQREKDLVDSLMKMINK